MKPMPFGQTVLLWRLKRHLTQAELARRAGLSRPNLSAIERGKREVTLGTLRALALALEIRPGILVDGVTPCLGRVPSGGFSRSAIERIADAVIHKTRLRGRREQALTTDLRAILHHRLQDAGQQPGSVLRRQPRAVETAWLRLKSSYPPTVVQSLLQRIADRQRRSYPITLS